METEKNKEKDLREVRDTIRIGLKTAELRGERLGVSLSLSDVSRLGIELLYAGELEIIRLQQEKFFF